ncbi:glycosyltransferase [Pseudonocardia kujensis]|uniref:glycosyltransferase family 2 protein n=1 Tax=Pseudonocardia kujensis TaxID=1128675 RepID=UPI001E2AAE85|nr:glycosyltransferase family 2 protein [Pseudonocardia kujensis]MCE0763132.1 glycosyltransferase [Pseudonocardia kujensis]
MRAVDSAGRPALSFLSPVHGSAAHLADMIDSVVEQTVADWELVVVDNGMSDDAVRIVEKYAGDQRVRLVRQEFQGPAGGVNAAAAAARGAYYAVLPGDGRLKPTFCERISKVLAGQPEIDVLCVDALPFLDGEDQPPTFRQRCGITDEPGVEHRVPLVEVLRGAALYTTAAIRATVWEKAGGWAADTPLVESLEMCLRMLAAGCDLRVLPEPLGGYRLDPDNPDHEPADWDVYDDSVERAFARVGTLTDDPEVLAQLRTTLRNLRYEKALRRSREAMRRSDPRTARKQAWTAFQQRPSVRPAVMWAVLRVAPSGVEMMKSVKARITA